MLEKILPAPVLDVSSAGGESHGDVLPGFPVFSSTWRLTAQLAPTLLEHRLPFILRTHTQTAQLPAKQSEQGV